MNKLFQLSFVPRSADFALLLLRLCFGLTLFFHHGLDKLMHHARWSSMLPDPLGVGAHVNLVLVLLAEVVCSAFVVLGVATRFAALIVVIEMAVAFVCVHGHSLAGGELALLNLGGFATILFAGGGRFVLCNRTNAPAAKA